MIVCPRCGKLNPPEYQTCINCAQPLGAEAHAAPHLHHPQNLHPDAQLQGVYPPPMPSLTYPQQPPVPIPQVPPTMPFANAPPGAPANFGAVPHAWPAAPAVQCLVCGLMLPAASRKPVCPRCRVPVGSIADPNDISCSSAIEYTGTLIPLAANVSVFTTLPVEQQRMPGWNMGAALCSTLWSFKHREWGWGILSLGNLLFWFAALLVLSFLAPTDSSDMPSGDIINTVFAVLLVGSFGFWILKTAYLGLYGNTLAAKSGVYANDGDMRRSLKRWNIAGGSIGFISVVLVLIYFVHTVLK